MNATCYSKLFLNALIKNTIIRHSSCKNGFVDKYLTCNIHVNKRKFSQNTYGPEETVTPPQAEWTSLYNNVIDQLKKNSLESIDERYITIKKNKLKGEVDRGSFFLDYANISVEAGNGGDGCISLAATKVTEYAGPDGGNGGNGGHVIFKSTISRKGLNHLKRLCRGENGEQGRTKDCDGKSAKHLIVEVPLGTIIKYNEKFVASLDKEGELYLAARGGAGGKGNIFFKSSTMTAPKLAEYGGTGEIFSYTLELRIMADIGLIGFPNAGKSTLLRAISRARPKVASYPFTTLNPHIGIIHFADNYQMPVADIPGLIEGAHRNLGMGIAFLRHIERCSCLLYVLDGSEENPMKQLKVLKSELEKYEIGLSERAHAIVLNKMDLQQGKYNLEQMQKKTSHPIIPISAKMGYNLQPLIAVMRFISEKHKKIDASPSEPNQIENLESSF